VPSLFAIFLFILQYSLIHVNQIVFTLFPWKCNGIFLHFISSILIAYMWKLTNFCFFLQPLKKVLFFFYWVCTGFKFFLSYYRQNIIYFVCDIFFVLLISLFILKPELDYMTVFYFVSLKGSKNFIFYLKFIFNITIWPFQNIYFLLCWLSYVCFLST
jgi:hypothetical protein